MSRAFDGSRNAMLLSEPVILASLEGLARNVGVPAGEVQAVLSETRRTAFAALVRAGGGVPSFGADLDEPVEHGRPPAIADPPEDPIAFVCWVHGIASRKAARRASHPRGWNGFAFGEELEDDRDTDPFPDTVRVPREELRRQLSADTVRCEPQGGALSPAGRGMVVVLVAFATLVAALALFGAG